jgi:hypothetical protein
VHGRSVGDAAIADVQFVDGSDGGYAVAARGLKAQLKSLTS